MRRAKPSAGGSRSDRVGTYHEYTVDPPPADSAPKLARIGDLVVG